METAFVQTGSTLGYPDRSEIALLLDQAEDSPILLEAVSKRHCAWCGDPPDAYGSHGICIGHAQQLIEQARARRNAKARRAAS